MEGNIYDPVRPVVAACRRALGRMGLALALAMVLTQVVSVALMSIVERAFPGSMNNPWISLTLGTMPIYLLGIPLVWLMTRKLPCAYPLEKHRVGVWGTVCFGAATYGLAYAFQMTLFFALEAVKQATALDYMEAIPLLPNSSPLATLLYVCLLGPFMEELFFRRVVLRRMLPYGRLFAVVVSATAFALFHGNFFQIFLAFGIGLGLGYITVRTGSIKHAVCMHILFNTYSSVVGFMQEQSFAATTVGSIGIMVIALLGGLVLFFRRKTIAYHLRPAPAAPERCLMQAVKSPGVWIYVLVCIGFSIWMIWGV